jgi:hypothetical protein
VHFASFDGNIVISGVIMLLKTRAVLTLFFSLFAMLTATTASDLPRVFFSSYYSI